MKLKGLDGQDVEFSDPLSPHVAEWMVAIAKAARGTRIYAENNEMLRRYMTAAFDGLTRLLGQVKELTLTVREDRFLYGRDLVYLNADREEGLPFTLYRNAFRRLTFLEGMQYGELHQLLKAIVQDYGGFDYAGDDLVTALWRVQLPNLRYLTIDAMTVAARSEKDPEQRQEIDRIQADIEGIVAALYQTDTVDEDDIVAGVSITKEDLEAFKDVRQEAPEDLELLDHATARAISDIPPRDLAALRALIGDENREDLVRRMIDILLHLLFTDERSSDAAGTLKTLQQLFDGILLGHRYGHAAELVLRLREVMETSSNMQEIAIARQLIRLFASEARVVQVVNAIAGGFRDAAPQEIIAYLRALGSDIVPHLLNSMAALTSPSHRRLICDLIVELEPPPVSVLLEATHNAPWFVCRDLLAIGQHLPAEDISDLIRFGLHHEAPKVRAYAVGMLRGYGPGTPDQLIAERLGTDEDFEVRAAAIRVMAARKTKLGRQALEERLRDESFGAMPMREARLTAAAYAAVAGNDSVEVLESLLMPSGILRSLRSNDAQLAAAFALGSVRTPEAGKALRKGLRSLSGKVRDACRRALEVAKQPLSEDEAFQEQEITRTIRPMIPSEETTHTGPRPQRPPTGDVGDAADGVLEAATVNSQKQSLERQEPEEFSFAPPPKSKFAENDDHALARAPTFDLPAQETRSTTAHLYTSGPSVAQIKKPHAMSERAPSNLPNAPTEDLRVRAQPPPHVGSVTDDMQTLIVRGRKEPQAATNTIDMSRDLFPQTGDVARGGTAPRTADVPREVFPDRTADMSRDLFPQRTGDVSRDVMPPRTADLSHDVVPQRTADLSRTVIPPSTADISRAPPAPPTLSSADLLGRVAPPPTGDLELSPAPPLGGAEQDFSLKASLDGDEPLELDWGAAVTQPSTGEHAAQEIRPIPPESTTVPDLPPKENVVYTDVLPDIPMLDVAHDGPARPRDNLRSRPIQPPTPPPAAPTPRPAPPPVPQRVQAPPPQRAAAPPPQRAPAPPPPVISPPATEGGEGSVDVDDLYLDFLKE